MSAEIPRKSSAAAEAEAVSIDAYLEQVLNEGEEFISIIEPRGPVIP
jgi:hypothetical protein